MNKKSDFSPKKNHLFRKSSQLRPSLRLVGFFVAGGLALTGFGISTHVFAQGSSAKTIDEYCGGLYGGDIAKVLACYSGAQLGVTEGCSTYPPNDTSGLSDACKKAAQAQKDGVVKKDELPKPSGTSDTTNTTTPGGTTNTTTTPGGTTNTTTPGGTDQGVPESPKTNPNQDVIDAITKNTESLNQLIDALNKLNPDAKDENCNLATNDKNFYPSGACTEMPITRLTPEKPGASSPAILFFNGGAWHGNDQTGQLVAKKEGGAFDTASAGYVMLDVEYRKGSSGVYYMLEDVLRGIRHVTENASQYGIDPSKIAIWGDSSGGSLVARAAATGKSGARAVVAWSAETNAWIGLFKSIQTLGIGIDHTTCIPTDLAGITNIFDLFTGGSGDIAEYGQGINSNNFSALGISSSPSQAGRFDPLAIMTQLTLAGRNAGSILSNVETISQQIKSKDASGLIGGVINVGTKKLVECIDNFNAMSPALFASPDTPPMFLSNMENDGLVGPEQAYGMRDKLRQLGIKSEALIIPPPPGCESGLTTSGPAGVGGCHLGYHPIAVCPSVKFLNEVFQPDNPINCETDKTANSAPSGGGGGSGGAPTGGSTASGGGGGSGGAPTGGSTASTGSGGSGSGGAPTSGSTASTGSSGSGSGGAPTSGSTASTGSGGSGQQSSGGQASCNASGGVWKLTSKGGGYCAPATKTINYYSCLNEKDVLNQNSSGGWQCYHPPGIIGGCGNSRPLGGAGQTCAYAAAPRTVTIPNCSGTFSYGLGCLGSK